MKIPEEYLNKFISLPPIAEGKKTFIFDLDETLVHCNGTNSCTKSDVEFEISLEDGSLGKIGFNIRPFTKNCLK